MSEQSGRRQRRRRGSRGGANRPRGESRPEQAAGAPTEGEPRQPRQDTRRIRGERPRTPPTGPPGPPGGRIQRAPSAGERPRRDRQPPSGDRDVRRDRGPRTLEVPVPQDERSLQLGAAFREAQTALRDARKALEKRKAEFGDEPEWMLEQYRSAEQRFEEISNEWSEHLSKTGRKVVRR